MSAFPEIYREIQHDLKEREGVVLVEKLVGGMKVAPIVLYPALTEVEVGSIESNLGCSLPAEYRKFLLNYNGATLHDALNIWGITRVYDKEEGVEQYFDIIKLQADCRRGFEDIPQDLIAVASDHLDIRYFLNPRNGSVTSYDTEFPDDPENLGSFTEFVTDYFLEYPSAV